MSVSAFGLLCRVAPQYFTHVSGSKNKPSKQTSNKQNRPLGLLLGVFFQSEVGGMQSSDISVTSTRRQEVTTQKLDPPLPSLLLLASIHDVLNSNDTNVLL
jgi:hypothetical protein